MSHSGTHLEQSFAGHSFVLGTCVDTEGSKDGANDDSGRMGDIVAGYRPMRSSLSDDTHNCVHMVTITQAPRRMSCRLGLRKRKTIFEVKVTQCEMDSSPLDTSKKVYRDMIIGGWKCKCEQGLFVGEDEDSKLSQVKKRLEVDLLACTKKLPPKACKLLKESTPIWINKCQKYGPKSAPVVGRGMCFHPEPQWLVKNGMSSSKCGGVELYEAGKYLNDVDLWHGKGGVMIHELSHAWHRKFTKDGYCNEEIKECYKAAMKEKLYDCVKVHNGKGETDECKAYAATDPMEYFAELSVAFLGGVGVHEDLEYNKWFPFNRKQLKDHDPRAFKMLQKMWGLNDDDK